MANELERYDSSDLQPYSPGGDLAPYSPAEDWGNTPVDYLDDRHERAFGQLDPKVERNVAQIAEVFTSDLASLGFVERDIQKCISFFKQMLVNPPQRMPAKKHSYQTWQFSNDPAFRAFCNYAAAQKFPPELIQSVAFWLQQLDDYQHGVGRFANNAVAQGRAPSTSAEAILDSLNDRDYEAVLKHNETVKGQTETYLRNKYGDAYPQVIATANAYLSNLPESHRAHFDQFEPGTSTLALNSVSTIEGLYLSAVGGHNLPTGSALQTEIQQIEQLMRTNRAAYNKDLQIQGRLRTLYSIRDGGR